MQQPNICNNPSHYYHYGPHNRKQNDIKNNNNNVHFNLSDFNEAGKMKLKMILMTVTGLNIIL